MHDLLLMRYINAVFNAWLKLNERNIPENVEESYHFQCLF